MIQGLGLMIYLAGLALLQFVWPWDLPFYSASPAWVLLGGSFMLYRQPKRRLYSMLLCFALLFDLAMNSALSCTLGYAISLLIPMSLPQNRQNMLSALLWMMLTLLCFDAVEIVLASVHGTGAWNYFWHHLPWHLLYHVLAAILVQIMTYPLMSLLHYQRFEYYRDVTRGRLG